MDWSTLGIRWQDIALVVITAAGIYGAVVACVRVMGQRSLASFSAFDLAMTVALGSIVGRVVLVRTSLAAGVVGLVSVFALQGLVRAARNRTAFGQIVDNPPVALVRDGEVWEEGLRRGHLRRLDVYENLRMQGIASLAEVQLMVLERNGSVSVIRTGERVEQQVVDRVIG